MKFLALISGGKDSFYNLQQCLSQGHELVALGNLHPQQQDEIDSFMFQTVGHDVIPFYSECLDVPLYREPILGSSVNQKLEYSYTAEDEIEDLYRLIAKVQQKHRDLEAVSCGAILSHYQRTRVENVCGRLKLTSLTYLWQRNQNDLMLEMCQSGLDARIVKVAAIGLNASHLGKSISDMYPQLGKLNSMYDVHICGEGGEFETIVFDSPVFKHKKLEIVDQQVVRHEGDVYYLKFAVQLVDKDQEPAAESNITPPVLEDSWVEFVDEAELAETRIQQSRQNQHDISFPLKKVSAAVVVAVVETPTKLFINNLTATASTTIEDQTSEVFNQLQETLSKNHLTFNNIQHVNILLSDMSLFGRMNAIYGSYFTNLYLPPSRICVETNIPTSALLQLSCVVLKHKGPKLGIHIRSRSYWGPQNIGPYSQSIVDSNSSCKVASLSGQIPLVPASMALSTSGGIKYNAALSLQHLTRVQNLVGVTKPAAIICFVTDCASIPTVCACWNHYVEQEGKRENARKNLVIVEVSGLPRGADVEWGGYSFEEVVSMYEDEEEEVDDDGGEQQAPDFSDFENSSTISITNGTTKFSVLFTSNADKVKSFLLTLNNTSSAQLLTTATPPILDSSAEYIPVKRIFNYAGDEFRYSIIHRQEMV
ncbi:uncharacterized protein LODBEIA_P45880 [Lodderomyces beijingensis]|uniref:Diphthine--ammonia ligase n=1 Tax=Lodderomyces beijingensis TaxID=1775926 RepID=A0ABP0ZQD6_9ASCO